MATTDMQRLIVSLEARTKAFENALNRANGVANSRARSIETRFQRMNKNLSSGFSAMGGKIATAFAAAGGARGAQNLLDAATRIDNALKVAGLSGAELTKVYDALYASAQRNAAPIEDLVTLYGRLALVQKELNVSSDELIKFSDNIALALRVSGQSSEAASGALLQLSQALGGGVVRAEEFNSILEGAPTIAQAAAAGLKEAGGSVATLRKLMIDGKISSEVFFRAIQAGAPTLEQKVGGAVLTIGQRLTNLQTSLINAAKRFNESSGAANTFGTAIDNVASYVNDINFDSLIEEIMKIITAFQQGAQWARNFATSVGQATGLDNVGAFLTGGEVQKSFMNGALTVTSTKALQDRINGAFSQAPSAGGALTEQAIRDSYLSGGTAAPKGGRIPAAKKFEVTPISMKDFAAPAGSGSGSGRGRQNDYQREKAQILERTAALKAETAAMAGLNPLVNDYGYAVEKARAVVELENAATEAKLKLTPELKASINALAEGYAQASVEAEKLAESQDKARQAAEDMKNLAKDVFGGFISDLRNGVSAADALQNALDKVLDKIIEIGLNSLFDGGGFGGLLSGLFGGGGFRPTAGGFASMLGMATGGKVRGPGSGRSDSVPAMLSNGEFVVNAAAAARNGRLLEAINSGRIPHFAAGGAVRVPSVASRGSGGGNVNIQVIEGGKDKADIKQERQPNGDVLIKMVLSEVKKDYGRGGFDKLNASLYGQKRATRKTG